MQSSGRNKSLTAFQCKYYKYCHVESTRPLQNLSELNSAVRNQHCDTAPKCCFFLLKNATLLIAAMKQVTCVISSLPDTTCMRKHLADLTVEMKSHLLSALIVETSCQFLVCCSPSQTRCLYVPLRCSFFCPKLAQPYTGAVQR